MTAKVFVSCLTHFVPNLTFFCERRPGLDVKLESSRLFRGFTHKERGNFGNFWPQLIRNDLQGHALRASFDALVDEDQERESFNVQYRFQCGQVRSL